VYNLNFKAMKLIYTSVILLVVSFNLSAQITYDTSYTRQWNSQTSVWESFDRIISSFEDGLVTSEMIQVKKEDHWVNYNFKAYYYDNGRIIEEFEQYWNESKLRWEDNYRKLYSYDADGKLMQIMHQNIFKGKYVNSSKEILIYTSDGKLKEKIIQKLSSKETNLEKAWSNFLRYQYYYNSNDILINENLAEWNNDSWGNTTLSYSYNYDFNGNLTAKTKCKVMGSNIRNLNQETFVYNKENKLLSHTISEWNKRGKAWMDSYRGVYENNSEGNIVSINVQKSENEKWINDYSSVFSGNNKSVSPIEIGDIMTFSIHPANFGNYATLQFTNPYSESYYVSIHSANGQLICSGITNKNEISISSMDLERGSYYVELQGSSLYSGKFSIE
jgi:hypothetical protein